MGYEQSSNCWYRDVCDLDDCDNCIRYMEMKYLLDNSQIPKNRQVPISLEAGVDYEAFCQLADIKDDIVQEVSNGLNLFICSKETGNGKTSWAIKLLLKYFDEIWAGNGFRIRGLFIHVPTFLNELKDFDNPISQSYKEQILTADLVVWDDIASYRLSDYDITQLLTYIDRRVLQNRANIYTANVISFASLTNNVGARLASRIWNTSSVIELKGKDKRYGSTTDIE